MDKKVKVMMAIWSMEDGGAQRLVCDYLKNLNSDEWLDLKLFVYKKPTNSTYDKFIVENDLNVTYINGIIFQLPIIRTILNPIISKITWYKTIKKFKPDIIHVHISSLLREILFGISMNKVPIKFATLHSYPKRFVGSYLKAIKKAFNIKGVIPICITNEQAEVAKDYYGISNYELLYNGIDINYILSHKTSKKSARKILGIDQNKYVIIGVGRLEKIKRFDYLIESFFVAHKQNPNTVLYIAGEGKEKNHLIKLVKQLNLQNCVHFLGFIDNPSNLYYAADMLAMTSYSEACSLVLLEAQVCGLSCVISAGVPSESIVNQNVKKLSINSSKDEWASAMLNNKYQSTNPIEQTIDDYDIYNNSLKLKQIYMKYWRKYKDEITKEIYNNY